MKTLTLGSLKIPVTEYASQGNAILGIRDSGKSYTATWLAERLLEAHIPFVAFDPIGIWKYLRVAAKGRAYPVVVAGGKDGDLPLTPHSAPEIVRAAMRQNIPLVLDLYSLHLSKADWKKIVEQSVRLLLYENGEHGLRHIFIEEAAEFAPQRVGPDQGAVYAEIEKLARMGGNARLGYTLINQRAEEVNKAVLELCDCLFLHRQKGRNSLTALGKWLDIGDVAESKPIIASLPQLPQGDCWVWPAGTANPVRVHIPEKNTFHPDRRALVHTPTSQANPALDVSEFVKQMSSALEKHLVETKANDPAELRRQIAELKRQLNAAPQVEVKQVPFPVFTQADFEQLNTIVRNIREQARELNGVANSFEVALKLTVSRGGLYSEQKPHPTTVSTREPLRPVAPPVSLVDDGNPTPKSERIIKTVLARHFAGLTKTQIAILSTYSVKGGGFANALSALKSKGHIVQTGETYTLTPTGGAVPDWSDVPTGQALIERYLSTLPKAERSVLAVVLKHYPDEIHQDEAASQAGYAPGTGGVSNAISWLNAQELITKRGKMLRASETLFMGEYKD